MRSAACQLTRRCPDFRSGHKEALDDLFVQVLGMLSAEGLITMERVTLDGTKIKANAGGNTFRRREKLEAHLALAREQVEQMNAQAAKKRSGRGVSRPPGAARRGSGQPAAGRGARGAAAARGEEARSRGFVARASATDPEAHVMRNGEGGTVPSYNVQLVTDTAHGLVVNVEATTDAIDYRQLEPALERCKRRWVCRPRWWPTAITPTTRRCGRRNQPASISTAPGKIAGVRWSATPGSQRRFHGQCFSL